MSPRRVRPPARTRVLRPTLLIVHEGYAEEWLLRHLKAIYTRDGNGPSVTLVNARGGGAATVVNVAVQRAGQADRTAAMFDTDAGWTQEVREKAERCEIHLLLQEPCIEATLLSIADVRAVGTTRQIKEQFERQFGGPAHQDGLIPRKFTPTMIELAKGRVAALSEILNLMTQGRSYGVKAVLRDAAQKRTFDSAIVVTKQELVVAGGAVLATVLALLLVFVAKFQLREAEVPSQASKQITEIER